nr:MAG TPA: hypothetical protein [Caudoviricetes sp.]
MICLSDEFYKWVLMFRGSLQCCKAILSACLLMMDGFLSFVRYFSAC